MRTIPACLALLILIALPSFSAPDKVLLSAPPMGAEKYTVHLAGMLGDVIQSLAKTVKRQIVLQGARNPAQLPAAGEKGIGKAGTPVTLDFDNATLTEIIVSLCKQAGLVYDSQGTRWISLREGDPTIDPRPVADLADYLIRVTGTTLNSSLNLPLQWGTPLPDAVEPVESLQISFNVMPKTPEAELALAGYDRNIKATTDKGGALAPPPNSMNRYGPPGAPGSTMEPIRNQGMMDDSFGGQRFWVQPMQLVAPPKGVKMLTKVESALYLYSKVETTELKLTPADEGKTVTQGDISATLKAWKAPEPAAAGATNARAGVLRATISLKVPPLAGAAGANPQQYVPWERQRTTVSLIGKDGRKARNMGYNGGGGSSEGTMQYDYQFYLTPDWQPFVPPDQAGAMIEPDYILLKVSRFGNPDKTLPFVLENVPVP